MTLPRILYIDIDSARTDHFSCYGYERRTTPNVDAIAGEGVRFESCYVSDSPCLPSRTALFSGKFGITTGVVNHGGRWADPQPQGEGRGFQSAITRDALGSALRRAGLYTCSISPFAERHSAYQIWNGFQEMHDTGGGGYEPAEVVFDVADRWLDAYGRSEGWFLHVNFWDPHGPYDTRDDYGNPFIADPAPAWLTQAIIDRQRASYSPNDAVTPRGISGAVDDWPRGWPLGPTTIANRDDWKSWIDAYDIGMRYADDYVGALVAKLRSLDIYDDTVIIISADHGENQGELEVYGDHQTADQHTNSVPLIIRWPGITDSLAGSSVDALIYQLDLAPTLVELLGGEPPTSWDGSSFASMLTGDGGGRDHLILSQGAWSCQRSARWDDYLLIRTYHTGHKNYPSVMLFDVRSDPHETENLAGGAPHLVDYGVRLIDAWVGRTLGTRGGPDPLFEVIAEGGPFHARSVARICARLRETGREDHADWLERYGGLPRDPDRLAGATSQGR